MKETITEPLHPMPRSGLVRPDWRLWDGREKGRQKGIKELLQVVLTEPLIPLLSLRDDEMEKALTPGTDLYETISRQERLVTAVKTLGAEVMGPDHLRRVFMSEHQSLVLEEAFPRNWEGDPILAPLLFGLTELEVKATSLKYGIQDGKQKTYDGTAGQLLLSITVTRMAVSQAIFKFRGGEKVQVLPNPNASLVSIFR